MSDDELADKFRQCAAWGGLDARARDAVLELALAASRTLADVSELTQLLRERI